MWLVRGSVPVPSRSAADACALPRFSGWSYHVKRTLDIVISVAALLALAPLMAVIAVAIRLEGGRV